MVWKFRGLIRPIRWGSVFQGVLFQWGYSRGNNSGFALRIYVSGWCRSAGKISEGLWGGVEIRWNRVAKRSILGRVDRFFQESSNGKDHPCSHVERSCYMRRVRYGR